MYWSWTLNSDIENLLGFLIANNVEVIEDTDNQYLVSLISIGIIIGRVDFIFNKVKIEK